jgi:hypothetical protein
LPEDEEVLWAARSRGPTWREWPTFTGIVLFVAFALLVGVITGSQQIPIFILAVMTWYFIGSWFYVFGVTSRRVVILRDLPFRSWIYAESGDIDPGWPRIDIGRGKIQFGRDGQPGGFVPSGLWSHLASQRSGMKQYIDNVPDIEAVRGLILDCIAAAHSTPAATPRSETKIPPNL